MVAAKILRILAQNAFPQAFVIAATVQRTRQNEFPQGEVARQVGIRKLRLGPGIPDMRRCVTRHSRLPQQLGQGFRGLRGFQGFERKSYSPVMRKCAVRP